MGETQRGRGPDRTQGENHADTETDTQTDSKMEKQQRDRGEERQDKEGNRWKTGMREGRTEMCTVR